MNTDYGFSSLRPTSDLTDKRWSLRELITHAVNCAADAGINDRPVMFEYTDPDGLYYKVPVLGVRFDYENGQIILRFRDVPGMI